VRAWVLRVRRHVRGIAVVRGWAAAHWKHVRRIIVRVAHRGAMVVDGWVIVVIVGPVDIAVIDGALIGWACECNRAMIELVARSSTHRVAFWFYSKGDVTNRELLYGVSIERQCNVVRKITYLSVLSSLCLGDGSKLDESEDVDLVSCRQV
jgi:hypothetical protein